MRVEDLTGMSPQEALDRLSEQHLKLRRISDAYDWDEDPALEIMKLRLLARHHDVVEDKLSRQERDFGDLLEAIKDIATNTEAQAETTSALEQAVRNVEHAVRGRR